MDSVNIHDQRWRAAAPLAAGGGRQACRACNALSQVKAATATPSATAYMHMYCAWQITGPQGIGMGVCGLCLVSGERRCGTETTRQIGRVACAVCGRVLGARMCAFDIVVERRRGTEEMQA